MSTIESPSQHRTRLAFDLTGTRTRGTVVVILKNPSWPDALTNSTVRIVVRWAGVEGFSRVEIVNLFAYRSTDNSALNDVTYEEAVGMLNDDAILEAVEEADVVVAGWGAQSYICSARYRRRTREVLRLLRGHRLHTVGPLNSAGHPYHPNRGQWTGKALQPWLPAAA